MQKDELKNFVETREVEIKKLQDERAQAIYEYVLSHFSNNDVVKHLPTGKLYGLTLTRQRDTNMLYGRVYIVAYPITRSGLKAKIGCESLEIDEIEFVRKGIEE